MFSPTHKNTTTPTATIKMAPVATSTPTSGNNSAIKGGGRASLSNDTEALVVDYLMAAARKEKATTNNQKNIRASISDISSSNGDNKTLHQLERERKRFVKRLVARYEREQLHRRVNSISLNESTTNADKNYDERQQPVAVTANATAPSTSGKVRVELVEAVFSADARNAKKKATTSSKKSNSSSSFTAFKPGNLKKVMVLPRATTVTELLALGQSKLRIKPKPVRVFIVGESAALSSQQHYVDLTSNLAGVADGTTLYITTTAADTADTNEIDNEKESDDEKEETEVLIETKDPLEAVKKMYMSRRRQPSNPRPRALVPPNMTLPAPHPKFAPDRFLDSLPNLSGQDVLPAVNCRNELLLAIQDHRVVIICGETGCGKSTQVPQFLWQAFQQQESSPFVNIIVTQPRRVAATSLARRVAEEMQSALPGQAGSLVGHQVRLDRSVSDTARIVYCTVGILLRRLLITEEEEPSSHGQNDNDETINKKKTRLSLLEDVTHVIVDEVHERDSNTDFLLTLLSRAVLPRNPHLRIILMSATASAQLFMEYFAAHQPRVIHIPGRTFPVEMKWLQDWQKVTNKQMQSYRDQLMDQEDRAIGRGRRPAGSTVTSTGGGSATTAGPNDDDNRLQIELSPRAVDRIDYSFIQSLIATIIRRQQQHQEGSGQLGESRAILVFLPGKAEIESLYGVLIRSENASKQLPDGSVSSLRMRILKLHSGIPRGAQQAVFDPVTSGTVKVVLATNIAETSITIPDVCHVIDTGRVKESRYNSETRIKELVTVWASQASAKQRAGRAGRTTAGCCYRLYSEQFFETYMPEQTSPEMVRTPLDELILQFCLLYEQRRDEHSKSSLESFPKGANPFQFLSQVPEPPPIPSLRQACQHLLDVGALRVVQPPDNDGDCDTSTLYRLTPLGFHLSQLPMDAKVGKMLIVGCLLGCLEGALTVAATLSSSKASCFYQKFGAAKDSEYQNAIEARSRLIENGFGGKNWKGGTVKGDLIAAIACYREWVKRATDKERYEFACKHALDHVGLKEIQELRNQYLDLMVDAGFVSPSSKTRKKKNPHGTAESRFQDDALLTSCCLVAGLYPNVATLMRPRKGSANRGGRLLTKEGDCCRPQMQSFQRARVQNAAETGKDAYAVYHGKHRSVGTGSSNGEVVLNEVNFVSRYALLLFCGGTLEIVKNAIIVDGWLKFKIGDKSVARAVLILALREELEKSISKHISRIDHDSESEDGNQDEDSDLALMNVIRRLLADE